MERGRGPTRSRGRRLLAPPRPAGAEPGLRWPALRVAAPVATTLSLLALAVVTLRTTTATPLGVGARADAVETPASPQATQAPSTGVTEPPVAPGPVGAPASTAATAGSGAAAAPPAPRPPAATVAQSTTGTATTGTATGGPATGGVAVTTRCADSRAEARTAGTAGLDLTAVTVTRRPAGLTVRFELAAPPAGGAAGMAVAQSWQVVFARGDTLSHVLTVERLGAVWTSEFIDFADGANDRRSLLDPPSGGTVEIDVPAGHLDGLVAPFTWWATASDDQLGDTCPDAALAAELALDLPPEGARIRFPG